MAKSSEFSAQTFTAIMFTDIAGFSQKLADNEVRAFELLKTHDALIRVLTAKFDGTVLKSLGDSFMVEFPSDINAVKCAIEIQKRFWNFNRGKDESDTIRVRAGIHLGEVTIRHGDLLGEDSTIASRIEAMTEPNRISISSEVYNHIKDLLPIHVFKVGMLELKDISRQVEVYEVLIDSIPELAQPSLTAIGISSSQQNASVTINREADELIEAKKIEETKQRLLSDQAKVEEERNKTIQAHYIRAETFFEVGELEKAEQELAEIAKLDPQQRPPVEKQKQEEGEKVVQRHLTRAKEFFAQMDLNAAEEEVNEIFRLLPLHVGAQQLLMQIEEARYRIEEKKRAQQTETAKKEVSEDELKIEALIEQAQTLLQEEKFSEATFVMHDLFLIDPNHSGGRRLEESIRQAKQAKDEWLRIQAEQPHSRQHLHEFVDLQKKVEEQIQLQTITTPKKKKEVKEPIEDKETIEYEDAEKPRDIKKVIYITATIIAVIAASFGIYKLLDIIFPKTTTIAILRFTNAPQETKDITLFNALPYLLAEDFLQCEHLTVIAPTSSLLQMPDPTHAQKTASALNAEYLLTGTIQENRGQYSIEISLLSPGQEQPAVIGKIEGQLSTLRNMRLEILSKVLEEMGVRSNLPEILQPPNTNALANYLQGVHLMQLKSGMELDSARKYLRTAIDLDPSYGAAYAALADVEIRTYQAMNDPEALQSAAENAQRSLRCSPNIPLAHRVLGTYNRLIQKYNAALYSVTHSLALMEQNPECYRELALLALTARKFDDALTYATEAKRYDPTNTESLFTLALAQHMKQDYSAAQNTYQLAQMPGENDLMLMAFYVQSAWISEGNYEKVVHFCEQMLRTSPENYRYYYWLGRAYQLSLQISTAQQWLEKGLEVVSQAIEDDPNDAIAYAYAGLIHSRLGKFNDGEAAMNKALKLDSTSVEIMFRNADLFSVQRNKQKAIAALDKALRQQYDYAEILNPDLSFIAPEPEFLSTITRKIEGNWPVK